VTFVMGRQIGWTEKKQQVPSLRSESLPRAKSNENCVSFRVSITCS
jgi:hypothetical protein